VEIVKSTNNILDIYQARLERGVVNGAVSVRRGVKSFSQRATIYAAGPTTFALLIAMSDFSE
jgi:hypothetical protein